MLSVTKIMFEIRRKTIRQKRQRRRPNNPEPPGTLWRLRKAKRTACKGAQQKE